MSVLLRRPLMRHLALALLLGSTAIGAVIATAPTAMAQEAEGAITQNHADAIRTAPGKFVQDLGDQAISAIADKKSTVEQRNDKFRQILRTSFDLPTIGRFVIGRSWNSATPEQQQEYTRLFQELVIKTYGERLALYTGEGFTVVGTRQETEKDTIVSSQITHPDGSPPTTIDWRIRLRDGKLGVIDVSVEGVSMSVTQRQEYTSVIQRNGGQLDGLLEQMRDQLQAPQSPKQ